MSADSQTSSKPWARRYWKQLIVGTVFSWLILTPFPGLGTIFPIRDALRGHPHGTHGTQPSEFVGLWIPVGPSNDESVKQAFYLTSHGRVGGRSGMTSRRWHFDNKTFFIDAVSLCGNCYQGNVTCRFFTRFLGSNEVEMIPQDTPRWPKIAGRYRRVEVTDVFKEELNQLKDSSIDSERLNALNVLDAIKQAEHWSLQNE